jgi:ATP-binding cassette, subfamily B, bacterial MsbA
MNSAFRRPPNPNNDPNKPMNSRDFSQLRRLYAFTKPYRWALAVAVVTTLISSGLGLVFPKIIGDLLDTALKPGAKASDLDWVVFRSRHRRCDLELLALVHW